MRPLLDDYFKSEGISVRKQRSNGRRRYSSEDNKNQQRRDNREFAVDRHNGHSKQEPCHVEKQKFTMYKMRIECDVSPCRQASKKIEWLRAHVTQHYDLVQKNIA